jgi:hypothetical protein
MFQVEMTGSSVFDYIHHQDHSELAEQLGLGLASQQGNASSSSGLASPGGSAGSGGEDGSSGTLNPDGETSLRMLVYRSQMNERRPWRSVSTFGTCVCEKSKREFSAQWFPSHYTKRKVLIECGVASFMRRAQFIKLRPAWLCMKGFLATKSWECDLSHSARPPAAASSQIWVHLVEKRNARSFIFYSECIRQWNWYFCQSHSCVSSI